MSSSSSSNKDSYPPRDFCLGGGGGNGCRGGTLWSFWFGRTRLSANPVPVGGDGGGLWFGGGSLAAAGLALLVSLGFRDGGGSISMHSESSLLSPRDN